MNVLRKAIRKLYHFNCPNCGSDIEADHKELTDIGCKTSEFFCPTCKKVRYIPWSALRTKIIYDKNIR